MTWGSWTRSHLFPSICILSYSPFLIGDRLCVLFGSSLCLCVHELCVGWDLVFGFLHSEVHIHSLFCSHAFIPVFMHLMILRAWIRWNRNVTDAKTNMLIAELFGIMSWYWNVKMPNTMSPGKYITVIATFICRSHIFGESCFVKLPLLGRVILHSSSPKR